ncbi:potassium-transporting ATPase subunit KdpB, partial [Paracidovorax wautersii]|uniref:potassium-transporting ATPase subunit KdpB n=1 Tax=Paracidovorax wautersii TaxID=1177982 RepID=UPI0031D2C67A
MQTPASQAPSVPSSSTRSLMDSALLAPALRGAFTKLNPAAQWRNPVMFVVYVGSIMTTLLWAQALAAPAAAQASGLSPNFILAVALGLWFTVLFANFAEALAEGRSKAQAASLKGLRKDTWAKKLKSGNWPTADRSWLPAQASDLRRDDVVMVETGDVIPLDGEVLDGVASVDESAITGESAPVVRESGGDFSAVTGGTRVLSDWLVVRIAVNPGESFLDRMISMVEAARRQKTPNEIALTILLVALTIVFLVVTATLLPFSLFSVHAAGAGGAVPLASLIALLVCLIPTTIGGLLSAVGVAGMSRMMQANVIATSGRAVEAAGDVDVLLLDKTGTITHGNRQASAFVPAPGCDSAALARAALLASLSDETPEGRSIVTLAHQGGVRADAPEGAVFVPFTAQTRMSGIDLPAQSAGAAPTAVRKGAVQAVCRHVEALGGQVPAAVRAAADDVARRGSTPLAVAEGARMLGIVELKDVVKAGIRERFAELRRMGIQTVMITGDNRLTAAAIAAEAGVDDFLAEATPEDKLARIRKYQAEGHLVAMTGDGTNDAPALAQADVA